MIATARRTAILLAAIFLLAPAGAAIAETGDAEDLLGYDWEAMKTAFIGEGEVVMDGIEIIAPEYGENSASVPVTIKLSPELQDATEIVVMADYNPFPLVVKFLPNVPVQEISLRMRMERSSPIRVAARGSDGIWHAGAIWVVVKGGGCSVGGGGGALARGKRHGKIDVAAWGRPEGSTIRVRLAHPMLTGLTKDDAGKNIPAYFVTSLELRSKSRTLVRIEPSAPISANPTFSLDIDVAPEELAELHVVAADTGGESYASEHVTLFMQEFSQTIDEMLQARK